MKRNRTTEKRQRPFTEEQLHWMAEYRNGMPARLVAARLGITKEAVWDWAKVLNYRKYVMKGNRIPPSDPRRCQNCHALRDRVKGSNDTHCGMCIKDMADEASGARAARIDHLEILLDFLERCDG